MREDRQKTPTSAAASRRTRWSAAYVASRYAPTPSPLSHKAQCPTLTRPCRRLARSTTTGTMAGTGGRFPRGLGAFRGLRRGLRTALGLAHVRGTSRRGAVGEQWEFPHGLNGALALCATGQVHDGGGQTHHVRTCCRRQIKKRLAFQTQIGFRQHRVKTLPETCLAAGLYRCLAW